MSRSDPHYSLPILLGLIFFVLDLLVSLESRNLENSFKNDSALKSLDYIFKFQTFCGLIFAVEYGNIFLFRLGVGNS